MGAPRLAPPDVLARDHWIIRRPRSFWTVRDDCTVCDSGGAVLAALGMAHPLPAWRGLARLLGFSHYLPRTLALLDDTGAMVLRLEVRSGLLRTHVRVFDSHDASIGAIRQRDLLRKRVFDLSIGAAPTTRTPVGAIAALSERGWHFAVMNTAGVEVGTIGKRLRGRARDVWLSGGDYDLRLRPDAPAELRALALAAAVTVDFALVDLEMISSHTG